MTWTRLDRPRLPFLVIVLSPLVTVPITLVIISVLPSCSVGDNYSYYRSSDLHLAFLPGMVNLLPFLWLLSSTARVRWVAGIAGVTGAARCVLSQLLLTTFEETPDDICPSYDMAGISLLVLFVPLGASWALSLVPGAVVLGKQEDRDARRDGLFDPDRVNERPLSGTLAMETAYAVIRTLLLLAVLTIVWTLLNHFVPWGWAQTITNIGLFILTLMFAALLTGRLKAVIPLWLNLSLVAAVWLSLISIVRPLLGNALDAVF